MKKRITILPIVALLCIASCGVKKNAGIAEKQDLLQIQGHVISQDMYADKPILGLLWQNDSLQITVNQGRQLQGYRASADTMYLYEGASDSLTNHTRQYSIYQPTQELLIIKYNDSLVYPIMPMTDPCEYPLDIKSMGAKKLQDYYEKEKLAKERAKNEKYHTGVINASLLALELRAGTYLYNANSYQLGIACDCVVDSTKTLILNLDGSWQQYENGTLKNCGMMRKTGFPMVYDMYNDKTNTVFFLDTIAISRHIIGLKEDKRRRSEHIPYASNEFLFLGRGRHIDCEFIRLFSCKQEDAVPFLFGVENDRFRFEGSTCGWQRINK